ncbi:MAG: hypothetical protein E7649_05275 [Ruminococcaceae bacterium]|nr:hypothetical protein [Oscillospiraceae bacterium]
MYVRPSYRDASRIKLPDNYSGNAFSNNSYSDMPPPARQTPRPHNTDNSAERPNLDIPPKSSPLAEQLRNSQYVPSPLPSVEYDTSSHSSTRNDESAETDIKEHKAHAENRSKDDSSIFSSLIPKGFSSNNFPFGHGIGGEELLILGMMLLVFLSGSDRGEVDSEFILLLGLLLFAG